MIIGIPSEIKNNESRVALTPSGAKELSKKGHHVYVQSDAGAGSGLFTLKSTCFKWCNYDNWDSFRN